MNELEATAAASSSASGTLGDMEGRATAKARAWLAPSVLTVAYGDNWVVDPGPWMESTGPHLRNYGWTGQGEEL